jgi:glycosyltransferase involved in cell wall biosynthesis
MKKSICFFSGPSFEKWNYNSCETSGIGGSETWAIKLSEELATLGYRVLNFADCSIEGKFNGVEWFHFSKLTEFIEYNWFDYFISSRTTDVFRLNIRAGKKFTIIHDIWLSSENTIPYQEKVDKFLVLSEWHKQFVSQHHGLSLDRLIMTTNGIDLKRYEKSVERNPYRLHWSSSLDRGLDTLLYLFDFIKQSVPKLELHIFYGIDNWLKVAKYKHGESEKIRKLQEAMKKPGVFYHGRVGQEQLAEEQLKASLWAYPTDFEETNCITAIECQAAGLPVIASNYAGLQTTVNSSGILLGQGRKGESSLLDYRLEFVSKCIELLTNKALWQEWSQKSLENARKFEWSKIAKQWSEQILC